MTDSKDLIQMEKDAKQLEFMIWAATDEMSRKKASLKELKRQLRNLKARIKRARKKSK